MTTTGNTSRTGRGDPYNHQERHTAMRLTRYALVLSIMSALAVAAPSAQASGSDLGRQVLPPGDGWASSGTGTTGGSAATAEHVHTVANRAELVAALADPAP